MAEPSAARKIVYNTLINDLKVIDSYKRFTWLFAFAGADTSVTRISLINPPTQAQPQLRQQTIPSPFTADRGFASTMSGLSPGNQPYIGGFFDQNAVSQNDHFHFTATLDDISADNSAQSGAGYFAITPRSAAGEMRARSASTTTDVMSVPSARGFQYVNRNAAANFTMGYASFDADPTHVSALKTRTSATPTSSDWFLTAWNANVGDNHLSARTIAFVGVGRSLLPSQIMPTLAACRRYLVAVGAVS